MTETIKYAQLPFLFSAEKLLAELDALEAVWIAHFNKAHYEGGWSGLPLRSVGGQINSMLAENHGSQEFMDTPLFALCPYMKSIAAHFDCVHHATRLLKLDPGAMVREHRDADLNFENGEARIHIPITTNDDVDFYLDGEKLVLKPGECWYMNFDLPHSLANRGSSPRVHLVLDLVLNDAVRALFDQADAARKKMAPVKTQFTSADQKAIAESLRTLNTPTSLKMAEEIEVQIKAAL